MHPWLTMKRCVLFLLFEFNMSTIYKPYFLLFYLIRLKIISIIKTNEFPKNVQVWWLTLENFFISFCMIPRKSKRNSLKLFPRSENCWETNFRELVSRHSREFLRNFSGKCVIISSDYFWLLIFSKLLKNYLERN